MTYEQFQAMFTALHRALNSRAYRECLAEAGELAQAVRTEEAGLRVMGMGHGGPEDARLANPNRYTEPQDDPTQVLRAKGWDTSKLEGGQP